MALLSGLESIRVKDARRPAEAPWSAEISQQLKDLKDEKTARLKELLHLADTAGAKVSAVVSSDAACGFTVASLAAVSLGQAKKLGALS